jgi:hypothetical protein
VLLLSVLFYAVCPTLAPATSPAIVTTDQPALVTGSVSRARNHGSILVPAYHDLPLSGGHIRVDLAITLCIRNASPTHSVRILSITLLDIEGRERQRFQPATSVVPAMGLVSMSWPGSQPSHKGASTIKIDWSSESNVPEPIAEAIMLGQLGSRSVSFSSRGWPLEPQN